MFKIKAENLPALFRTIAAEQELYLPVKAGGQVNFAAWSEEAEVSLETLKTVKSPKDAFFPQSENLYTCVRDGKKITIEPEALKEQNFVVFGMKACDVQGVKVLDRVFLSDPVDSFYAARREHGTIVALACHEPEESCFCKVFGIDCAEPAADVAAWMIHGELFTITNYATVTQIGWMNTYKVLIIPFLVSVFYIFLLRQNFMQIPNELYLAAKVDGTSDMKYLWKVMVPLSLPTLISITILKMMGAWNSYIWPRLVANDEAHRLITNGLRNAFTDTTGDVNYPVQMAAVAIVSAPLCLVFIFLRIYIMAGVSRSGIKG